MKILITEGMLNGIVKNYAAKNIQNTIGVDPKDFNVIGDIDIEKEAPGLSSVIKKIADPSGLLTKGSKPLPGKENFAPEIPNGSEMMHPLGHKSKITSGFGLRNVPGGSKNHKGVDIGTPSGSPVYAPLDGVVTQSTDTTPNPCGGFVKLNHGTIQTKFCHLSDMVVKTGEKVKKGQLIAHSGGGKNDPHPGASTGPHLHYEILNGGGIAMNPTSVKSNIA